MIALHPDNINMVIDFEIFDFHILYAALISCLPKYTGNPQF